MSDSKQQLDWQVKRRLRALELKESGWTQRQIAVELGVTEGAVSQWMKMAREGGREGLIPSSRRRPMPGLNMIQLERLAACLDYGARTFGFDDDRWDRDRFLWLLENKFSIKVEDGEITMEH